MCRLHLFVLDSHLAIYCPFGFLLVMFPLGSRYFVFVFLTLQVDASGRRCGIIVSIPDHCLPFYFEIICVRQLSLIIDTNSWYSSVL